MRVLLRASTWQAGSGLHAWWSSSSKSDSLTMADSEAPMPPVFMHSSTMMACRVFLMLLLMVSMSKGFKLIRSMTCAPDTLRTGRSGQSVLDLYTYASAGSACGATGRGGCLQEHFS